MKPNGPTGDPEHKSGGSTFNDITTESDLPAHSRRGHIENRAGYNIHNRIKKQTHNVSHLEKSFIVNLAEN